MASQSDFNRHRNFNKAKSRGVEIQRRQRSQSRFGKPESFITRKYTVKEDPRPEFKPQFIEVSQAQFIRCARDFFEGFFTVDRNTDGVVQAATELHAGIELFVGNTYFGQMVNSELIPWDRISFIIGDANDPEQVEASLKLNEVITRAGFRDFFSRWLVGTLGTFGLIAVAWKGDHFDLKIPSDSGDGSLVDISEVYSKQQINKLVGYTNHELGLFTVVSDILMLYLCLRIKVVAQSKDEIDRDSDIHDFSKYPAVMRYYLGFSIDQLKESISAHARYMNLYESFRRFLPDLYKDFNTLKDEGKVVFDEVIERLNIDPEDILYGVSQSRRMQIAKIDVEASQYVNPLKNATVVRTTMEQLQDFGDHSVDYLSSVWYLLSILLRQDGFENYPNVVSPVTVNASNVYYEHIFKLPELINIYTDSTADREEISLWKKQGERIISTLNTFLSQYIETALDEGDSRDVSELLSAKHKLAIYEFDGPLLGMIVTKINTSLAQSQQLKPNQWRKYDHVESYVIAEIAAHLSTRVDLNIDFRGLSAMLDSGDLELEIEEIEDLKRVHKALKAGEVISAEDTALLCLIESKLQMNLFVLDSNGNPVIHQNYSRIISSLQ
jgi:hypothetical protein